MTETASGPALITIPLDTPIVRGEQSIDALCLRKPDSGALRGLTLVDLGQLKVDSLIKLLPRITVPPITEPEAAAMEPADLMAVGTEVGSFLLQKRRLAAVRAE